MSAVCSECCIHQAKFELEKRNSSFLCQGQWSLGKAKGQGSAGASPEERHKDDQRIGVSLV